MGLNLGKKRTTYLWVMTILQIVMLFFILDTLIFGKTALLFGSVVGIIKLVLLLIDLVIYSIFLFKLYKISSDLVVWTHIVFSFSIFDSILSSILAGMFSTKGFVGLLLAIAGSISLILTVVLNLVLMITFVKHLKRAQKEKLMNFS